jgi:endoglucanase
LKIEVSEMEKASKQFLETLLSTYSPSGREEVIQEKWLDYVSEFADEVKTDLAGNAYGILNPEAEFKVLLAGHADEIAFMVNYIDDKGFLSVVKAGGINPKLALGNRVKVLGKEVISGVVGVTAEHHGGAKGEVKPEDIYIDCGFKSKEEAEKFVCVGDYILYAFDYDYLQNDLLVGRGLDNRTGSFIVAEVLKSLKEKNINVGVYAVSTVNEETNMGGAYFAASNVKPSMAIACDVTFATDFPNMSPQKHGKVDLAGGPVLTKGAPINFRVNDLLENAAKDLDMKLQYELTPRMTGTDADKMRLTGEGVPVALVSLPLRYMHAPSEIVSMKVIEEEIELLIKMIENLTGSEDLRPVRR